MSNNPQTEKTDIFAGLARARLLARAETGDLMALPELRRVLAESPDLRQRYRDLSFQAQATLVKLASGDNLRLHESLSPR